MMTSFENRRRRAFEEITNTPQDWKRNEGKKRTVRRVGPGLSLNAAIAASTEDDRIEVGEGVWTIDARKPRLLMPPAHVIPHSLEIAGSSTNSKVVVTMPRLVARGRLSLENVELRVCAILKADDAEFENCVVIGVTASRAPLVQAKSLSVRNSRVFSASIAALSARKISVSNSQVACSAYLGSAIYLDARARPPRPSCASRTRGSLLRRPFARFRCARASRLWTSKKLWARDGRAARSSTSRPAASGSSNRLSPTDQSLLANRATKAFVEATAHIHAPQYRPSQVPDPLAKLVARRSDKKNNNISPGTTVLAAAALPEWGKRTCSCGGHGFDVYETPFATVGICQAEIDDDDDDDGTLRRVAGALKSAVLLNVQGNLAPQPCAVCGAPGPTIPLLSEDNTLSPGARRLLPAALAATWFHDDDASLEVYICPNGHIFGHVLETMEEDFYLCGRSFA